MRACNNNMHNPIIIDVGRGYACYYYCMPSSLVLLHIYCPCFPTFWHCHPYILQHFNGNVFTPLFHWFFVVYSLATTILFCVCKPHPFRCSWSCETHVGNNVEMVFNYTEVLVALLIQEGSYKDSIGERHCAWGF